MGVREDRGVYEFHGWVTGRDRADREDRTQEPADATVERVRQLLADAPVVADLGAVADLRHCNGDWHVWLAGLRNHDVAPGFYGLLHVHDEDQENWNDWLCWTMLRGRVEGSREERLSPHFGRVEDDA